MSNSKKIGAFLENGFLVSPDALIVIEEDSKDSVVLYKKLNEKKSQEKLVVVNKDILSLIHQKKEIIDINWKEFERAKSLIEKGKDRGGYDTFLDLLNYEEKKEKLNKILLEVQKPEKNIKIEPTSAIEPSVIVLQSYNKKPKKREVGDFVKHFKVRYDKIKNILTNHQALQNIISIGKLKLKKEREPVTLIGLVRDKRINKNGNTFLTLEDPTGEIKVLISKNNRSLGEIAKEIVLDEVLAISGTLGKDIVFANKIIFPGLPLNKELKKSPNEVYAAFISDIHVGSRSFLAKPFLNFINWLNGNTSNEKLKKIGEGVKYLFIAGDLVAGVGVYPGQETDLIIPDIKKQYEELAEYLLKIPKNINVIIAPGNHDATRLSEPQPPLDKNFAKPIWDLPNAILVSSPSLINIHSSETFPGFDVLLYHGSSYHYYKTEVESLRLRKAHENPTLVTEFLLQKRHIAPTHESTVYIPDDEEDPLIIEKVPDVFVTGDHHRSATSLINNINLISCSCFQKKTDYEEKRGYEPDPGMVPVLNLKTREVKILDFNQDE